MEKRVILAFVLSFLVLFAFRALYTPPPPAEPATTEQTPASEQIPATPPANSSTSPKPPPPAPSPAEAPPAPSEVRAEKLEELSFDVPLYTATVSNSGGVLRSFRLKQYTDGEGQPLELINQESGNKL